MEICSQREPLYYLDIQDDKYIFYVCMLKLTLALGGKGKVILILNKVS